MTPEQHAIAIQLARMYGVAETLEPLEPINMHDFEAMITAWTEEYSDAKKDISNIDELLEFFECKIKALKEIDK